MNYTDRDGNKVYKNEVVGERVSFIASSQKKTVEEKSVTKEKQQSDIDPFSGFAEEIMIDDSELPF